MGVTDMVGVAVTMHGLWGAWTACDGVQEAEFSGDIGSDPPLPDVEGEGVEVSILKTTRENTQNSM